MSHDVSIAQRKQRPAAARTVCGRESPELTFDAPVMPESSVRHSAPASSARHAVHSANIPERDMIWGSAVEAVEGLQALIACFRRLNVGTCVELFFADRRILLAIYTSHIWRTRPASRCSSNAPKLRMQLLMASLTVYCCIRCRKARQLQVARSSYSHWRRRHAPAHSQPKRQQGRGQVVE